MKLRVASIVMLSLVVSSAVTAALCLHEAGRITGGPTAGLVAVGDVAVIGTGARLVVTDIADSAAPTTVADVVVGEPATTPYTTCVAPLAGTDGLVVVADSCGDRDHLVIMDLTDPGDPTVVSSMNMFDVGDHAVFVDDVVWVSERFPIGDVVHSSVTAFDLQDPTDPEMLGRSITGGWLLDMDIAGDALAVLEAQPYRLTLVDVSSPMDDPPVLSYSAVPNDATTLAIVGDRVFIATHDTIEVFNVSEPTAPELVSSVWWSRLATANDLVAVGDRLYLGLQDFHPQIAEPGGGLEVFGLDDPSSMSARDSISFSSGAVRLAAAGSRLLVADPGRGLRVFDTDAMSSPIHAGRLDLTFDEVWAVDVDGGVVFLADHGLRLVDLDANSGPAIVGAYELDTPMVFDPTAGLVVEHDRVVWDVAAEAGAVAVLATEEGVLDVVDVSVAERPVALGQLEIDNLAESGWRLALSGSLAAAVGNAPDGLVLVDLSDPSHPIEAGRCSPSGRPSDIAIRGDLAFVAVGPWPSEPDRGGLDIVDISDPSAPAVVSTLAFDLPTLAVAVDGNLAVAADTQELHVIDLSDPSAPIEIGALSGPFGFVSGLALDGGSAWLSAVPGSAALIRFADPAHPSLVARSTWQPWTNPEGPVGGLGVAGWNGRAVVADGVYGVRVLDPILCNSPFPSPSESAASAE